MGKLLPKFTYSAKELAQALELKDTDVRTIARFLKIQKPFGTYLFTQKDISRIENFLKGGDKNL